jgi:CBS domain-containing membrane protein
MHLARPVSEIMTASPVHVAPTDPVSAVWAVFLEGHHHVPVLDDGRLVGLVTPVDVAFALQGAEAMSTTRVGDVMTSELVTLRPDHSLRDAARRFATGGFHALPVVDGATLVGLVTTTDLMRLLAREP